MFSLMSGLQDTEYEYFLVISLPVTPALVTIDQ